MAYDDNGDRDPDNRAARWEMWALLALLLILALATLGGSEDLSVWNGLGTGGFSETGEST